MKNILLILIIGLLFEIFSTDAQAQQEREVKGVVTSASDNKTLEGVSVRVENTQKGTLTDSKGRFKLTVNNDDMLSFSSVGFKNKQLVVGTQSTFKVELTPTAHSLDQIVIIGYGKQKGENVTGAISSVDVSVLDDRPIPDIGRGLQGVVPGMSVRIPDGEVGSEPMIEIRGFVGSLYGNHSPLILVDNVEVPSIQYVNPNNIKSISVLKDAAASSIYGAKAAFGVILITTKDGAETDGVQLTYSANLSWQKPFKDIELAGIHGMEYSLAAHNNMQASGPAGGFWRIDENSIERAKEWQEKYAKSLSEDEPMVYNRDWYWDGSEKFGVRIYDPAEMMIKNSAFSQKHNLGVIGKSNNTKYNFNFSYLGEEGMMKPAKHDDYRRINADLSVTTKATDFLTIKGSAKYADGIKRYPNALQSFTADPWLYMYRWSRLFPIGVKENGDEVRDPYWVTKNANTAKKHDRYINLNIGTTVDITNNWDVKVDYSFSSELNDDLRTKPTYSAKLPWYTPIPLEDAEGNQVYVDNEGKPTNTGGVLAYTFPMDAVVTDKDSYIYLNSLNSERHTMNAYSTYRMNINEQHDFKLMLGANLESYKWVSHYSQKNELINNDNPQFNFAVGKEQAGGGTNWSAQLGFFGRLNYSFLDKYLLEANIRYDGTSKFPENLRWRWFPSFSGGWILSKEHFMEAVKPILSFAKFRASYGIIGDQSVPNSLYLATMGISKNSWLSSSGDQFFQLGTPGAISAGITWQDIETLNFGTDLKFFDNKLGVTFDWFQRYTKNMIIPGDAVPATYGTGAPRGNFGDLETKGWEIEINYKINFENGLYLGITGNLSDAVSVTTKGADWQTPWENRNIYSTFATGQTYGDIYGYVTDRLFQKGDFVYDDNGDFVQTTIVLDGSAKVTNKLAGDNPVYQTKFEDGNQVLLISPGDVKFKDLDGDGHITPGKNTFGDHGDLKVIGNSRPRYQYGLRLNAGYKGFDISVFFQGVGKRSIWGAGQLAIPGFHSKDGAMPEAIASDFWTEDRTDAFYPRAWNLGGANQGFTMVPQTRYLLDMSYLRLKNILLGYTIPPHILSKVHLNSARVYISLENLLSFDNLRGLPINPEAISGHSMLTSGNYNLGRTGTSNPAFKSASVGIQIGL